jgi:hypothetical protein
MGAVEVGRRWVTLFLMKRSSGQGSEPIRPFHHDFHHALLTATRPVGLLAWIGVERVRCEPRSCMQECGGRKAHERKKERV